MKMESEFRLDLVIEGKVQDVGYRYFAKMKAESLSIKGSVKNMTDGTVFLTAQGETEAMNNFIKWCFEGPPGAVVKNIKKIHGEIEDFRKFNIIF